MASSTPPTRLSFRLQLRLYEIDAPGHACDDFVMSRARALPVLVVCVCASREIWVATIDGFASFLLCFFFAIAAAGFVVFGKKEVKEGGGESAAAAMGN